MRNWKINIGNFFFKYRSFTPIPLILGVFLLFKPVKTGKIDFLIDILGISISIVGEILRILAVGYSFTGTSGRESYLRADNLNTSGIYSITRNPLYIGNFCIFTGLIIVYSNFLALGTFVFFLFFQYYFIILAEENYLLSKYGKSYNEYRSRVNRILPSFGKYIPNRNRFDMQKVIYKENDSVFNMLVMLGIVLVIKEFNNKEKIANPIFYIMAGILLFGSYIFVKIQKKKRHTKN